MDGLKHHGRRCRRRVIQPHGGLDDAHGGCHVRLAAAVHDGERPVRADALARPENLAQTNRMVDGIGGMAPAAA